MRVALSVGQFEIRRVAELDLELPVDLLPDWRSSLAAEHADWLAPRFYAPDRDRFRISIHSWLVRSNSITVLIDTCGGNGKERPTYRRLDRLDTAYLGTLGAAGVRPSDVDLVICTHLHVDHVGWNTVLVEGRWRPTFPKASYILSRVEHQRMSAAVPGSAEGQIYADSIGPVVKAGQARFVEGDERIAEGLELMPTPGHSPGHMAVLLKSKGKEVVFSGDVVHHPLQIRYPDWNSALCEDGEMARSARRRVLSYCADTGSVICPAHFAAPHYGRVRREQDYFHFTPGDDAAWAA